MKILVLLKLATVLTVISADFLNKNNAEDDVFDVSLENEEMQHTNKRFTPDWESLDTREIPSWFDNAKFGVFIHWGVFSVPSFGEWFWYNWQEKSPPFVEFMEKNYPPGFTYANFAQQFRAEFFDPNHWAEILKSSGAKYVVLTSKHHEGFTLWPSKYSWNWNAMDVGPKRDLVGELAEAIREKTNMHFGLYHSLYEWYHPLYLQDKANNFETQDFVRLKTMPELYELVNTYKPDVIWSDGDWEANDKYWDTLNFLAWLYNDSPVRHTVVVNDRWGRGVGCKHGDFVNCQDRYNPGVLQTRKWENAMTIDKEAWAFRRNARLSDFLTTRELIETLVTTVSCGGNLLMNIGPTADGVIRPIFEERLRDVGSWLQVNGEAIFGTLPWTLQNDTLTSNVWYTSKRIFIWKYVYGITLRWPENNTLMIGAPVPLTDGSVVTLLGYKDPLKWSIFKGVLSIQFPEMNKVESQWGWTVKFAI
ncbi:alpha-L-fucosidase-like [Daphnia pulex]|uniref:alpha-L-fucosidase-like n=1 Tax=Daphnia pulex TaxID=6669 RepID=UPI001EDD8980|nr:alpha-L-fucosidase-like [Daphnia pulex]